MRTQAGLTFAVARRYGRDRKLKGERRGLRVHDASLEDKKEAVAFCSAADQEKMLGGNAARWLHL